MEDYRGIKRLGIMGGTFDPIHYGHLLIAEFARVTFELELVVFVPTGEPPHKHGKTEALAYQRAEMTKLAIADNYSFSLSLTEVERGGYSYAYDTVSYFKKECDDDCEIYFLTGADAIIELDTWKCSAELCSLCYFIAASRPGVNLADIDELPSYAQKKIKPLIIPALDISSTDIRRRVYCQEPFRYLLPDKVFEYIKNEHLYLSR